MILHKLNLANFRAFEQIEIDFDPHLNVIAGVNGVGKTSILDAIATMFSRALPEFTASTARPRSYTDDDISIGNPSMEVSGIFSVGEQRCHAITQRTAGAGRGDLFFSILERFQTGGEPPSDEAQRESRATLQGYKEEPNQPIVVLIPPGRLLPGQPQRLHRPNLSDKSRAYSGALEVRTVDLREFMEWFYVYQDKASWGQIPFFNGREDAQRRIFEAMQSVVSDFIPEFRNLRVTYSPTLRFLVDKNGKAMQINQLSDGERGLLAVVFDITRRLTIANPDLADPIHDGKGVILIDEIELHLHPKWQREALHRLSNTFAGCQFIVTTHSPQVLGEVEARCVQYLFRDTDVDNRVQKIAPHQALGLDSSRILEEVMGASSRSIRFRNRLRDLFRAIDKEEFGDARTIFAELKPFIGDIDPDLVRAQSMMEFLGETV